MTDESREREDGPGTLQVGLLLDSFVQPEWVYQTIAEINALETARIALVARMSPSEPGCRKRARGTGGVWSHLLYDLYSRWDGRKYGSAQDACAPCDVVELLNGRPVVVVLPDTAQTARCGVWSFGVSDSRLHRSGPSGFWQVFEHQPTAAIVLELLTEHSDASKVVSRSVLSTHPESVNANRNGCFWKASSLFIRELNTLYEQRPRARPAVPEQDTVYSDRRGRHTVNRIVNCPRPLVGDASPRYTSTWV